MNASSITSSLGWVEYKGFTHFYNLLGFYFLNLPIFNVCYRYKFIIHSTYPYICINFKAFLLPKTVADTIDGPGSTVVRISSQCSSPKTDVVDATWPGASPGDTTRFLAHFSLSWCRLKHGNHSNNENE